jgi:acetoin utilization deacetylase AcuC-like enzyme
VHCEKNFPARKAQSDWDINVSKGTGDHEYLEIVESALDKLLAERPPTLFIYDAGVDIYQHDPLGLLNISLEGIRERDRLVLNACREKGIPVMTVIGGGYDDDRMALAKRHAMVAEEAHKVFAN